MSDTLERIRSFTGNFNPPIQCKLNSGKIQAAFADAFASIERHGCAVELIVAHPSTKHSLANALHREMGYTKLWGARLEAGDVDEHQVFLLSQESTPRGVARIDLE